MNKQLTPFQKEMEAHLIEFKENKQYLSSPKLRDKIYYPEISDGLFPPIKHAFLQYAYDNSIPFHDYANHVRSSQMFCFNLFYPILKNESNNLITFFRELSGIELTELTRFEFEFSPEDDWLGEWRGTIRPDEYVTSTDLALFFRDFEGKINAFLLEIKFTEHEFTPCNGYTSNGNKSIHVCENIDELFGNYDLCYLQTYHPRKSPRTYFNKFVDLKKSFSNYSTLTDLKCPFINNLQCLRNHSLARALVENNISDRAFFCLIFHDLNNDIQSEWTYYYNLLSDVIKNEVKLIQASKIVGLSKDLTFKKYCLERYKL